MSQTTTKPKTSGDVPTQWPPKAHIVHDKDLPVKEGTIALCGAKLMGIHLGRGIQGACKECTEIAKRILQ